jgi:ketosteroid isomerase-like protein
VKSAKSIGLGLIAISLLAASGVWSLQGRPSARADESETFPGHRVTAGEPIRKVSAKSVERQIETLHEQGRQAALGGDSSFLEKYLTQDYVGIDRDGNKITKRQAIEMVKSAFKYQAIDEHEVTVHVYGDTAIVNVLASVKLTVNEKLVSGDDRAIFVWVKQQGKWGEVFSQITRVAVPTTRPGNNLGHDARPTPP